MSFKSWFLDLEDAEDSWLELGILILAWIWLLISNSLLCFKFWYLYRFWRFKEHVCPGVNFWKGFAPNPANFSKRLQHQCLSFKLLRLNAIELGLADLLNMSLHNNTIFYLINYHTCPFIDLLANFGTYLMIVFKIWLQGWEVGLDGGNPVMQGVHPGAPFHSWSSFNMA